jgi:hypothetical protein
VIGEKGREMTIIRTKHLTTFSVAPDGTRIAIGVADEEGQAGALMLPVECLKALMDLARDDAAGAAVAAWRSKPVGRLSRS